MDIAGLKSQHVWLLELIISAEGFYTCSSTHNYVVFVQFMHISAKVDFPFAFDAPFNE